MKLKQLVSLVCFLAISISIYSQQDSVYSKSELDSFSHIDSLFNNDQQDEAKAQLISFLKRTDQQKEPKKYFRTATTLGKYYSDSRDEKLVVFTDELINLYDSLQFKLPLVRADFLEPLAVTYTREKKYEESILLYQEIIALKTSVLAPDQLELARSYLNLGTNYMHLGSLEEASSNYKIALGINQKLEKNEAVNGELAKCYTNLGIIEKELQNFSQALDYYDRAIQMHEKIDDSFNKGIVFYNTAFVYLLLDQQSEAIDYLQLTKTIFIDVLGEKHGYVIVVNNLLFQSYWQIDSPKAEEYAKLVIEQSEAVYGPDHPRVGIQYSTVSSFQLSKGDCEGGFKSLQNAIRIHESNYKETNMELASLYNLQFSFASKCEMYSDSLKTYFEKTKAAFESINGTRSIPLVDLLHQYTANLITNERLEEAKQNLKQAFKINTIEYDTLQDVYLPETNNIINKYQGAESIRLLANIKKLQYNLINKDVTLLSDASNLLSKADSINSIFIQEINLDPESTNIGFNTLIALDCIETELQLADLNISNKAFTAIENYKGQKLMQSKNINNAVRNTSVPDSVLQKRRLIISKANELEGQIFQETSDSLQQALISLRIEERQLTNLIKEKYPDFFDEKYTRNTLDLKTTQSNLSENMAMIQYVFDSEKTQYFILAITADDVKYYGNTIPENLTDDVVKLKKLLSSSSLIKSSKRKEFISLSSSAYSSLIKPVETIIQDKDELLIIGDGISYYIPFEVLLPSSVVRPFEDLDYLIKSHNISYHYSATLMMDSFDNESQNLNGMMAFAPVFEDENYENTLPENRDLQDTVIRSLSENGNFNPLLYSVREVNAISESFKDLKKDKPTILLQNQATKEALKIALAKPNKFIHLATHSFANHDQNQFSGIACYQNEDESQVDNILYAKEIYNLPIKADLVVLSSCESGVGKLISGEGMAGLNRSFLFAGASNVIFSLWKVQDKVTAEFMDYFYTEVFNDNSYSESLRKTKLKMIESRETACPNFWSSFLLLGN